MGVRTGFKMRSAVSTQKRRSCLYPKIFVCLALSLGVLALMSLAASALENALPRLLVHFVLPQLLSIFAAFAVEAACLFIAMYFWR